MKCFTLSPTKTKPKKPENKQTKPTKPNQKIAKKTPKPLPPLCRLWDLTIQTSYMGKDILSEMGLSHPETSWYLIKD